MCTRRLIREISFANPLWGAPRIHGELLKLGIEIGQTTVAKCMARRRRLPSHAAQSPAEHALADLAMQAQHPLDCGGDLVDVLGQFTFAGALELGRAADATAVDRPVEDTADGFAALSRVSPLSHSEQRAVESDKTRQR
jgi:hypothetical protein